MAQRTLYEQKFLRRALAEPGRVIGWQLVGYPGPRMSYRDEIDKHFGQPWRPKPASLEQIAGRPGKPWEDEKG